MKKTILATACLTIFSASTFASLTVVDRDGVDNGEINLTGNVPERCVVSMDSTDLQLICTS
ncbi:hypothetical protein [Vibrio agarivorans]|uniref:hypothetical protein n=1 Tax=Vibrio agarivorans TaxID=153622 RepID=UPI002231CC65|nr:hypothetical protein [Vibrio agarivorans]